MATAELLPSRQRERRLDVVTGIPVASGWPFVLGAAALAAAGVVTASGGRFPVYNGASALLRGTDPGPLQLPSVPEALIPLWTGLLAGAVSALVALRYLDEPRDRWSGVAALRRRWRPLVAVAAVRALAGSLLALGVTAGLAVLLDDGAAYLVGSVVALVLTLLTWLAEPAVVLEGLGPAAALRRSAELVTVRSVHGLLTFGVAVLAAGGVSLLVLLPLVGVQWAVRAASPAAAQALAATLAGVPVAVAATVLATGATLLYLDRRVEHEGLVRRELKGEVAAVS